MADNRKSSTERKNKAREKEGRPLLCTSTIDQTLIYDMLINQKGRCAYTNIPLHVTGDWKFGIERINDDIGYIKSNVVLVVCEVNQGFTKWSRAKAESYWGQIIPYWD
ncbi:hypothetical protein TrRE_jg8373 [Triparma retinervis]|uniref:Uncharacterized protein n=1 Tax=Triparma retinervis TaxID=2557542 RepID=A0A9W6ZQT5_9STRA|nr:hypothetical protein TrRE_jg8373 [Triparma retinervis]